MQQAPAKRVNDLTKDQRAKALKKSFELNDVVYPNPAHEGEWLAVSSQDARVKYRVRLKQQTCGCKGYQGYGMCRHLVRVSYELHLAKREAEQAAKDAEDAAAEAAEERRREQAYELEAIAEREAEVAYERYLEDRGAIWDSYHDEGW